MRKVAVNTVHAYNAFCTVTVIKTYQYGPIVLTVVLTKRASFFIYMKEEREWDSDCDGGYESEVEVDVH